MKSTRYTMRPLNGLKKRHTDVKKAMMDPGITIWRPLMNVLECQRLVMFEAQKGSKLSKQEHTSELSKVLDRDMFEKTYRLFLEQADENVISGSDSGGQSPKGFDKKSN